MKHITPALLIFAFMMLSRSDALACSCGRSSVEDAFLQADAVFMGEVIHVRKNVGSIGRWFYQLKLRLKGGAFDDSVYSMSVTLSVSKHWKGPSVTSVVVQTPDAKVSCICGYDFEVGKSYVVYAYGSPLHTSICSRTKPSSEAASEIPLLDLLMKGIRDTHK